MTDPTITGTFAPPGVTAGPATTPQASGSAGGSTAPAQPQLTQQQVVAGLPSQAQAYAGTILTVASEQGVSPFLVAAIGMRETGWGTARCSNNGVASTGTLCINNGDYGLMQVNMKAHPDFFTQAEVNNAPAWQDPYTIVTYAIKNVLKAYLAYIQGQGYSGDQANQMAIAAYNAGPGTVIKDVAAGNSPDTHTTGGDYSTWVLAQAASYLAAANSAAGVQTSQPLVA